MTKSQLIEQIKVRKELAKTDPNRLSQDNFHQPSFNLGYHDALGELLEWITDNEKVND